jgi:hypothetical protein
MRESSKQQPGIDPGRFVQPGPHPESLLRLTLVRQLFEDEVVRLCPRRVDRRWFYEKHIPVSLSGFNPSSARVYYSAVSAFADWLREPQGSARRFNEGDYLVPEVLFAVHDYLHAWAYQVINEIRPGLDFGFGEITPDNAEAMVFCHLATEAVATVGLDYWYLPQFDLNSVLSIGTAFEQLTVSYSQRHIEEYRRYCPDLIVDRPFFLVQLGEFYCTGVFKGFSRQDLKDSPLLLRWLQHEIAYGAKQREYTRMWMQHLSRHDLGYDNCRALSGPVACNLPWMRELLVELGSRLWAKVVEDQRQPTPLTIPPDLAWQASKPLREFRFTNLAHVAPDELARLDWGSLSALSFDSFVWQYVSQFDYESTAPAARQILSPLRGRREPGLLRWLFRGAKPRAATDEGPRDIFLIN